MQVGERRRAASWLDLVGVASSVVAPITVVSALLVYAARTRTNAFFGYFGLPPSLLNFSPQDYLLASADTAFGIFASLSAVCVFSLVLLRLGKLATRRFGNDDERKRASAILATVALGGLVLGSAAATWNALAILLTPDVTITVLISSALLLARTRGSLGFQKRSVADYSTLAVIFAVVTAATFWGATIFAEDLGAGAAVDIDQDPTSLPYVDLYSTKPLDVSGDLVQSATVNVTPTTVDYRYDGFRLLEYANNRWLLIVGHRDGLRSSVLVVKDDDDVRVEIASPAG